MERYSLEGKVVTMDPARTVLERGVVHVEGGRIVAVQAAPAPAPAGFDRAPIRTGGTIYPGLIELHNHLSYNILPLWTVPRRFDNRGQWQAHPDKRRLITGPMQVLGKTPRYVPAIARYVECKCLLSGVTTSQGMALYGVGIQPYYQGLTRNVEDPGVPNLPRADTRIADMEATLSDRFLERLEASSCLLLHMSEGADPASRRHFEALRLGGGGWAITPALAGIHCVPLTGDDWQVMARQGGALVWSPLSNYLLYGQTADVRAAKEAGVRIGLGADWSPSGSKNLLCELKVAYLVSESLGHVFHEHELVAMVTIDAARILKWDGVLGSLEAGKRADLLVIAGRQGDPYRRLIQARESSVALVVVDGVARCGQKRLVNALGGGTETWMVGGTPRLLNLEQGTDDPLRVPSLAGARDLLREGLADLPGLARVLEGSSSVAMLARLGQSFACPADALDTLLALDAQAPVAAAVPAGPLAFLVLEQDGLAGESLRPHLRDLDSGEITGFPVAAAAGAVPYSELLRDVRIDLDPLTVVDDEAYFARLAAQPNLPAFVKAQLPLLYGVDPLPEDARFVRTLDRAVVDKFATAVDLATFMRTAGLLSLADRQRIVEQALILLERVYVHLPLKRAMHAIDPIQRLKLLQYQLERQAAEDLPSELAFHNEMTSIFTSVRDLHTNYLLPHPFAGMTAFLPFLIEEYFDGDTPHYVVSKVVGQAGGPDFQPGVEVLYWNGVPIRRAVELNAERQAGGNRDARQARGIDSLTIRPLLRVLPPDEEWVTLRYRTATGRELEMTQRWLVFPPGTAPGGVDPNQGSLQALALGYDVQTDVIQQVKKVLYAPWAVAAEQQLAAQVAPLAVPPDAMATTMPRIFRARAVETAHGTFGYLRIFSFDVADAVSFVAEFVRLAALLPQAGLIVDVRDNPGGLIYAAERLLQVLTPRWIQPQRAQFINSPLVLDLCRRHAPSPLASDLDLGRWVESIAQAVQTGATYSNAFPITPEPLCNDLGQRYYGPVVLIIDALSYSATDIFAAGFQDHRVGKILGTSGHSGAGGANVWTHRLLQILMGPEQGPGQPFPSLPHGAGMRVAVRRTLRVGDRSGVPVEDLGVVPDALHPMSRRDLLEGNVDLVEAAAALLAEMPAYKLDVEIHEISDSTLRATALTQNIDWLDVYFDRRPQGSLDMTGGGRQFFVALPAPTQPGSPLFLELYGYRNRELVAMRRLPVEDQESSSK